jgi:hypothetical protein
MSMIETPGQEEQPGEGGADEGDDQGQEGTGNGEEAGNGEEGEQAG